MTGGSQMESLFLIITNSILDTSERPLKRRNNTMLHWLENKNISKKTEGTLTKECILDARPNPVEKKRNLPTGVCKRKYGYYDAKITVAGNESEILVRKLYWNSSDTINLNIR